MPKFGEKVPCQRCGKEQVHYLNGKTSDQCQVIYPDGRESDYDYVPSDLPGVTSDCGDYVVFAWCGSCGQIQSDVFKEENNV